MRRRLVFVALLLLAVPAAADADDPAPASPPAAPPQASPTPASPPAPPPAPPPAMQELIYLGEATRIVGRVVRDPAGDEVGRVVDVLVDDQGTPRAALIDFGGFLGVGNRRIAVAWRAIRFLPAAGQYQIRIDMTADQIKNTPDYKPRPDAPPVTMAAPPASPGTPALGK